jgi:peptide-methionine (S)-S-oxide reductase
MRKLVVTLAVSLVAACLGCATSPPLDAPAASSGASRVAITEGGGRSHEAPVKAEARVGVDAGHAGAGTPLVAGPGHELAAFALGCFWGSEDTFRHVRGVVATAVGYAGGHTDAPTYETVCSHTTGHAETVLVEYDPALVTYAELLSAFWTTHDPTTKNRQGPDVGDQYRSAIFTFSPAQATIARASMSRAQTKVNGAIVTEITPMPRFWIAEDYHQQYDEKTGRASCAKPLTGESI